MLSLQAGGAVVGVLQKRGVLSSPAWVLPLHSLVSLLITIVVAAVSYRFFESFFLRLKDRFSRVQSRPVDA